MKAEVLNGEAKTTMGGGGGEYERGVALLILGGSGASPGMF